MSAVNEHREGYKKTKVGWIPEDWEVYQMGQLVKFSGGSQPPRDTFKFEEQPGYVRLIQTRDYRTDNYKTYIKESDARKFCDENDIMIGRYGPPIFQLFRGLKGAYNVALIKAIPNLKIVEKNYAWYFFNRRDLRAYLESLSQRSGGQTGIEMDRLKKYPFPIPKKIEQQKIAQILTTWDTAISLTQQLIEQLQLRKKGLMQQLLTGKKRLPGFEGIWEEVKLGSYLQKHSEVSSENNQYPVLTSSREGLFFQKDYYKREVASKDNTGYNVVPRGFFTYRHMSDDLIFKFNINEICDKGIVSTLYPVFTVKEGLNKSYLLYALNHGTEFPRHALKQKQGGSRTYMYFGKLSELKIKLPSTKEQGKIVQFFISLEKELQLYNDKLQSLQTQKKGLMQQLLTGQIRVKVEAENHSEN